MAEISRVEDVVASLCTVAGEPCLESGDVASTGVGGLVAGAVAVWVYTWRKNDEYANRRNDIARIQANEIAGNMDVLYMQGGRQIKRTAAARAPSMGNLRGAAVVWQHEVPGRRSAGDASAGQARLEGASTRPRHGTSCAGAEAPRRDQGRPRPPFHHAPLLDVACQAQSA